MKHYLIVKLLAVHLVVIGFVMLIVWLSIDTLAAGYFVTLMEKYNISPEPAHAMFVESVHRYLLWTCLSALTLAVILSYLLLRRVLAPLTRMTATSRDIAAGNFSVRVSAAAKDEVGQLAAAFNQMAKSLEKMEKLRHHLMIDIAHELRTPLTNIKGYLEALNDGVLPPSAQTLTLLQDETHRLAQLVEDVLQLARADAAQGKLKPESIDLRSAVERSLTPFFPAFDRKSLSVKVHACRHPVMVAADRKHLARVMRNLTDNAVRYTPRNGTLDIRIDASPERVRVNYDNDVEVLITRDLPYLFERFFRGEKSRSRDHGGAGIGLAIVKELIAAHGGTVGAEPADGRIRIWFELPVSPPPERGGT